MVMKRGWSIEILSKWPGNRCNRGGGNKNSIVMEKGQLIEISVKVNSESFPWNTYSCGCGGCGSGSGTTSRGSGGFSSCSSCSGATSRGSSCTSNVIK